MIPEAQAVWLMGLVGAAGGSVLEPAGVGSARHTGSFWNLTEATSVAPPQNQKLITQPKYKHITYQTDFNKNAVLQS